MTRRERGLEKYRREMDESVYKKTLTGQDQRIKKLLAKVQLL